MKKILLVLFATASLLSCKKSEDAIVAPATGVFKTGTKWVYKFNRYTTAGAVGFTTNFDYEIIGQKTLLGETWLEMKFTALGQSDTGYFRKGATGYFFIENNISQLRYKIPAAVNDTWRYTYSNTAGDFDDLKVVAINENKTFPSGTFSCFVVEKRDNTGFLEGKEWYNESYMLVGGEGYELSPTGVSYKASSFEMLSFTP